MINPASPEIAKASPEKLHHQMGHDPLVLVGDALSDGKEGRTLLRHLSILLLSGLLHGFGIWWRDILSLHAVTGFLMLFLRSVKPGALLIAGVVLYSDMSDPRCRPARTK